jgi:type IV pilus assembly protein PilC
MMHLSTPVTIMSLRHVSLVELTLFTKHLSVMLSSSIAIQDALTTLKEQATSGYFTHIIDQILQDTIEGHPLSRSFAKHPGVFNTMYVHMVKAGEESGTLPDNMKYLADQLTHEHALKQKIQSAMIYPSFVLAAVLILGAFVSYFILPELLQFFKGFKIELPLATKILLFIATLVSDYTLAVFVSIGSVVSIVILFIKLPQTRHYWHWLLLNAPIIGRMTKNIHLTRFTRNLGVLLQSGVPITTALKLSAQTLSNIYYEEAVYAIGRRVREGDSIAKALHHTSDKTQSLFPSLVSRMIAVGEKTGTLDKQLLYVADFYDDAVSTQTKNLASTLEPILLLGIGLIVGFVAVAVISPIYELTGSIRR